MILNCSNYETTVRSLSDIFGVSNESFVSFVRTVGDAPIEKEPDVFIYEKAIEEFGRVASDFRAYWFHGTRVACPDVFMHEGILPKSEALGKIKSLVELLAEGLSRDGESPFSTSMAFKNGLGSKDEGPFGFFFKIVASDARGSTHNYSDVPESVEDLAGLILGNNYHLLIEKFKRVTRPCVVTFVGLAGEYELRRALWHVQQVEQGVGFLESALHTHTCYNGNGVAVSPGDIIEVDDLTLTKTAVS
ncbi:hypothetical protein [Uliginosibacterium sp. TH139]|uniref:hypothetical protein n=1 Tax=Uliginosibacterium sp. TH139 TaxID=2067453 RepID=UPI00117DB3A7|nr:hypothetical protein [Uliginosibacterium sp. TH139]